MRSFLVVLFFGLLIGCASQPPRIAQTPSGKPEVVIVTADRSAVRQSIISHKVSEGWSLEQETDSLLVFNRAFDEKTLILGSALVGSNAMRNGMTIRYTIFQTKEGAKVLVTPFNDQDTTEFNSLYAQLKTIKHEIEK